MKKILTESEKKEIRKLYYESDEDQIKKLLDNEEFRQIFTDFSSGRITEKEMEMKVKIMLLGEEVKYLREIFEDYPHIAERVKDSDVVEMTRDTIRTVNNNSDAFFGNYGDLNMVPKHAYSTMIIAGLIKRLEDMYPELKRDLDWSGDFINYMKFYHDDMLFGGFDELNMNL